VGFEDDAALWCAAFLLRSQRLLVNGLYLAESDGPDDGVGGASSCGVRVSDPRRVAPRRRRASRQLRGDLTRRHVIALSEIWPDRDPPTGVAAILDVHREQYPPSRLPPVEQNVDQVAEWVSDRIGVGSSARARGRAGSQGAGPTRWRTVPVELLGALPDFVDVPGPRSGDGPRLGGPRTPNVASD
jgi:hypothetical protein